MTTWITPHADPVQLLDDLDFVPTQPAVSDHSLGRLWAWTFNGHQPMRDVEPDHPIAKFYSKTVTGNRQPPAPRTMPGHRVATLWTRMIAKPSLYS